MKHLIFALAFILVTSACLAQPKVGTKAPDIALPTATGEIVSLSSLKGKVVLLDFWASWCGPCRISNREMRSVYKKYKEKGLEVFGVSIDENPQSWLTAVRQDKIDWLQVIDTRAARGNELTNTWSIQYIPSTFLIDKQGKIVAVGPEPKELDSWLKKLL